MKSRVHGSPPRAWGHRNRDEVRANAERFTPTCVGTSGQGPLGPHRRAVHPHVRGDISFVGGSKPTAIGSPPRAWGHQGYFAFSEEAYRFTPTCVGTSWGAGPQSGGLPVHPHVRGDIKDLDLPLPGGCGSPPRAWGHRSPSAGCPCSRRFTPTCVGTSLLPSAIRLATPVHPHVRGDIPLRPSSTERISGSPPRAWGHQIVAHVNRAGDRFTPTCVGTSLSGDWAISHRAVHPHVRGDILVGGRAPARSVGSPPRAWGHRRQRRRKVLAGRFTPTCVGTSSCRRARRTPRPVHPHVRGDISNHISGPRQVRGSPPRAWGHPNPRLVGGHALRFTPTCVGTSPRGSCRGFE